ncbi:MAG: peroxiredoxin-like family protein [Gammaproteobacteria bacterium]|nr:MAG: peroxiredoxin-like family protein [Gammaproteobacteria bacterium]
MSRFSYLVPMVLLLASACTGKQTPQQTPSADIPSYRQAAQKYMEKSKTEKSIAPEDLAVMQQAGQALAKRLPNPGLNIGEAAPDFSLSDATGKQVNLSTLLKQGPVVLVFYRGAWCPFCNMHLHVLNESLPQFKKLGAQLVAVTPQMPDKSAEQLKNAGYPFIVLSDLDSDVMKAYRLYYEMDKKLVKVYKKLGLDVAIFNGPGRYVLPVPGTFVIDSKGIVRARHATTDYTQRMEPADIIKALKKIRG